LLHGRTIKRRHYRHLATVEIGSTNPGDRDKVSRQTQLTAQLKAPNSRSGHLGRDDIIGYDQYALRQRI
jgi:hypothetical protein